MTREVVQALNVQVDGTYVDATFGRGGHTRAILSCLGPAGRVLAIDRDPEAHRCAKQMSEAESRLTFVQASFSELFEMVNSHGLVHRVTGLVLDLGVVTVCASLAKSATQEESPEPLLLRGPVDHCRAR